MVWGLLLGGIAIGGVVAVTLARKKDAQPLPPSREKKLARAAADPWGGVGSLRRGQRED